MITHAAILGKDGKVYTGRRHCQIIHGCGLYGLPKGAFKGCEQGFVDEWGRFLDREAAAKHALECGQITKLKFNSKDLFSEDLW